MNSSAATALTEKVHAKSSDAELICAIQAGHQRAMHILLERHEKTIKTMFAKIAPDFRDNGDMVQETLIRMWQGAKHLKNPYAFKTWLNKIVTHKFYDTLRKRTANATVSLDEPLYSDQGITELSREIICRRPKPLESLLNTELSEALENAVNKIPALFREAVVMRDLDGFTYEQIAYKTQTELGTVKSRINRGRCKMQKTINIYLSDRELAA